MICHSILNAILKMTDDIKESPVFGKMHDVTWTDNTRIDKKFTMRISEMP
jgi:hypothetical protein